MRAIFRFGVLLLGALALNVTTTRAATDTSGWTDRPPLPNKPLLSYANKGEGFNLLLECREAKLLVHVRGLQPQQMFPQPKLEIVMGQAHRAKHPDVIMFSDTTAALEFEIYTNELVTPADERVLDELEKGPAVTINFDKQKRSYPPIPAAIAKSFTDKCRSQFPAVLDRSK